MAGERPTRWQKAKQDWPGIRAKRELAITLIGGVFGAVMLLILGLPGASMEHVITVAAAGVAAAIFVPIAEFVWAWWQAPMRLLTADVIAIRERVEALDTDDLRRQESVRRPNVRLAVLEFARRGEPWIHMGHTTSTEHQSWAREVSAFLTEHATEEDGSPSTAPNRAPQNSVLALDRAVKPRITGLQNRQGGAALRLDGQGPDQVVEQLTQWQVLARRLRGI